MLTPEEAYAAVGRIVEAEQFLQTPKRELIKFAAQNDPITAADMVPIQAAFTRLVTMFQQLAQDVTD